jgi:hypothetical protein
MKIKNINGTSQTTCACGSWVKHWEKFSDQKVTYCLADKCLNRDLVGAHVQKANSSDSKWYIYPLCNAHNQSAGVLEVSDKKETCEK